MVGFCEWVSITIVLWLTTNCVLYRWRWNACGLLQMRSWWTSWQQLISAQRIYEQLQRRGGVNRLPRLQAKLNTSVELGKCPALFLWDSANNERFNTVWACLIGGDGVLRTVHVASKIVMHLEIWDLCRASFCIVPW